MAEGKEVRFDSEGLTESKLEDGDGLQTNDELEAHAELLRQQAQLKKLHDLVSWQAAQVNKLKAMGLLLHC